MSTLFHALPGRPVSVATGQRLLRIFWPEFKEINGCVFLAFQCSGGPIAELSDGKTETECFVNHTHIFDEFRNRATSEQRDHAAKDFDVVENSYDDKHPDFIAACEIGMTIASKWALKLKVDFPHDRFRVYYTQYDNPIVRFHKVRPTEPVWLPDEVVRDANVPTLRGTIVYDTEYPNAPITNGDRM
jgi:hypothetical protein